MPLMARRGWTRGLTTAPPLSRPLRRRPTVPEGVWKLSSLSSASSWAERGRGEATLRPADRGEEEVILRPAARPAGETLDAAGDRPPLRARLWEGRREIICIVM